MTEMLAGPVPDLAAVARFVDDEVRPHADAWDRAERIPADVLDRLGDEGLWAPFLPSAVGGADRDWVTVGRLHEEVGRGCSSLRSMLTVHTMVAASVARWGDDAQRDRWLAPLARGAVRGSFCLSEPDHSGSDAASVGTRAEQTDAGGWVLDGAKTWITGGLVAEVYLVFASTGAGVSAFLVPADAPGVRVTALPDMMGTRASMLARVDLTGVALGPEALLGPPGWATATVMTAALDLGRYSVACGSVGIVRAALDASAAFSSTRHAGGRPLREQPQIRKKVTEMVTARDAGRLLCEKAGRLKDADDPGTVMATWMAKYFASTSATRAAAEAVQIHGAAGFGGDHPVARLYRDSKVMEIIEGSTEIQELFIADEAYRGVTV